MRINITSKDGITLKTQGKYVTEDISVGLSDEDIENLAEENIVEGKTILGVEGTYKASGGGNTLKALLDTKKSADSLFKSMTSLTYEQLTELIKYNDTENVTNMSNMFYSCANLTTIPLLNTSNVTNMTYMLYNCSKLTTIPLLDTSKVTNMSYMFADSNFNATIPQFDTSKVINMSGMFSGCRNLTTIPMLNASSVTSTNFMFTSCQKLTTINMYGMKTAFSINNSTLLEASELVKIGSNCQSVTSSKTLTMGSTLLNKVTNVYVRYTGVELYEGITCNPCVICESTDAGAMLFTDYMTQKGWTLA